MSTTIANKLQQLKNIKDGLKTLLNEYDIINDSDVFAAYEPKLRTYLENQVIIDDENIVWSEEFYNSELQRAQDELQEIYDKATRVGLVNSTNMEIKIGRTESTLILNDMVLTYSCTDILNMLAMLEVYAKDCYNVTATHLINVKNLTDVDSVKSYNYTIGYPTKLEFQ